MAYDIDNDKALNLAEPYTRQHLKIFDLLRSGKAWNTDCFDQAVLAGRTMHDLSVLIRAMNINGDFNTQAKTLFDHTQNTMTDLENHLSDQFTNLTANLNLLHNYINEMAKLERLPYFNDLTQDANTTVSNVAGGAYTFLGSVSPTAMMRPSFAPVFMADTGSGTGGLTSPGTQVVTTPGIGGTPILGSGGFTGTSGTIVEPPTTPSVGPFNFAGAGGSGSFNVGSVDNISAPSGSTVPVDFPVAPTGQAFGPYGFAQNSNAGNVGDFGAYAGNVFKPNSADTSATPDASVNSFGGGGFYNPNATKGGGDGGGSEGSSGGGSSGSGGSGGSGGSSGGSGGSSGSGGGSACASMGGGLGSLLGKASQLMGGLGGMLGQMQGLMGSLMGGGLLNAIGQFGNLGALSKLVPGLGNLGSMQGIVSSIGGLAGGNLNIGSMIGNLGSMGGLISQIGQFGNIGALGSQLTAMLGGPLNALGNLTNMGNVISKIGQMIPFTQAIQGPPMVASYSPYAVGTQLGTVAQTLQTANLAPLVAEIRTTISLMRTLLHVPEGVGLDLAGGLSFPTLNQNQIAVIGNVETVLIQLQGMATYLSTPGAQANLGDITPTLTFLTTLANNLDQYIAPNPDITGLIAHIRQLIVYLTPLNNMQSQIANLYTAQSNLYDYGQTTGFGNVPNTISQLTGIQSSVGGLLSVPGLGGLSGLIGSGGSMLGNITQLTGAFQNIMPGNITGVLGGLSGLTTQLGSVGNAMGLGNIGQMIGGLGNLGGVGNVLQGGLGSLLGNAGSLSGLLGGQVQGLLGNFGGGISNLLSGAGIGNIGSLIGSGGLGSVLSGAGLGNLTGLFSGGAGGLGGLLSGGIGSILGGGGLGGIGQTLGGLMGGGGIGGIMGKLGGMIGGEKSMLGGATRSLQAIAGTFNVMDLKNKGCAGGALGNLASSGMQSAMGGSGNGGAPGSASSDGSGGGDGGSATDVATNDSGINSADLGGLGGPDDSFANSTDNLDVGQVGGADDASASGDYGNLDPGQVGGADDPTANGTDGGLADTGRGSDQDWNQSYDNLDTTLPGSGDAPRADTSSGQSGDAGVSDGPASTSTRDSGGGGTNDWTTNGGGSTGTTPNLPYDNFSQSGGSLISPGDGQFNPTLDRTPDQVEAAQFESAPGQELPNPYRGHAPITDESGPGNAIADQTYTVTNSYTDPSTATKPLDSGYPVVEPSDGDRGVSIAHNESAVQQLENDMAVRERGLTGDVTDDPVVGDGKNPYAGSVERGTNAPSAAQQQNNGQVVNADGSGVTPADASKASYGQQQNPVVAPQLPSQVPNK